MAPSSPPVKSLELHVSIAPRDAILNSRSDLPQNHNPLPVWAIVLIALAGVATLVAIALAVYLLRRRSRRNRRWSKYSAAYANDSGSQHGFLDIQPAALRVSTGPQLLQLDNDEPKLAGRGASRPTSKPISYYSQTFHGAAGAASVETDDQVSKKKRRSSIAQSISSPAPVQSTQGIHSPAFKRKSKPTDKSKTDNTEARQQSYQPASQPIPPLPPFPPHAGAAAPILAPSSPPAPNTFYPRQRRRILIPLGVSLDEEQDSSIGWNAPDTWTSASIAPGHATQTSALDEVDFDILDGSAPLYFGPQSHGISVQDDVHEDEEDEVQEDEEDEEQEDEEEGVGSWHTGIPLPDPQPNLASNSILDTDDWNGQFLSDLLEESSSSSAGFYSLTTSSVASPSSQEESFSVDKASFGSALGTSWEPTEYLQFVNPRDLQIPKFSEKRSLAETLPELPGNYEIQVSDWQVSTGHERPHEDDTSQPKKRMRFNHATDAGPERQYSRAVSDEGYVSYSSPENQLSQPDVSILPSMQRAQTDAWLADLEKEFACEHCEKVFVRRCDLRKHRKTHNPSTPCPGCDRVFQDGPHMRRHLLSKHPELSNREQFHCPFQSCKYSPGGKSFARNETLIRHMRNVHKTQQPP